VSREIARVAVTDHLRLCEELGRAFADDQVAVLLPRFSRLADAGMAGMDFIAEALRNDRRLTISRVAGLSGATRVCRELMAAAADWLKGNAVQVRHIETAHRFASAIQSARPADCLRALLCHHELHGGGLRWFVLRNDTIEPRTPPRTGSSRYRFRLWSLCRMATQCGVLRTMPAVLRGDVEAEDETDE
jgi:hypothetical protein